ncbi:hypothetical protein [Mucilaginibacter sp. SJ]|uniref:hypothetical protein n=1 Tax=Mucilaginibacter sp. SJ TaxID=3029053 RepID=UPI0023A99C04|nr:hypothetical protein [Mucilaginibacter sp. SJ]WEA00684.1 hypothetical protein MusilaSJ_24830 [Mucilaginibacter sp. SJ]
MRRIISVLLILCSCSPGKDFIVSEKTDYLVYKHDRYIQVNIDTLTKVIDPPSIKKISVKNLKEDTIYVFSTVLSNSSMLYSSKNISFRNRGYYINSFYKNFMNDASYSGIKKFNFIRIPPKDSLIINIDEQRILKKTANVSKHKLIGFKYLYFDKVKGHVEGGLHNLSEFPLKEAIIWQ